MKKTFFAILPLFLFLCMTGQAQHPQHPQHHPAVAQNTTSMTVSTDRLPFWLFLDDIQLNDKPVHSLKVEWVPEGEHYLRVEMDNREHATIGQYVMLSPANNQYIIENRQNMYGIINGHGILRPEFVVNYPKKPQGQLHQPGQHHQDEFFTPGAPVPMNNADFQEALTYIQSKNFDKDKMSAAKQILVNNFMTVNQIEQVCRLFSFDKDKLEFAKYAYSRCVDQNRYFMLNTVFSFESSKTELDEFVQQQH